MSGSPKYTSVSSNEQRRQAAERERQRREAQRRERERKARAAAVAAARTAARSVLRATRERCAQLSQAASGASAQVAEAAKRLNRDLARQEQVIEQANDIAAVNRAAREAAAAERAIADTRARLLAEQRQAGLDRVNALAAMVAELPPADRARFDPAGTQQAEQLLGEARQRAASDTTGSTDWLLPVADRLRVHVDTVLAARAARDEAQRVAAQAIEDLTTRVTALTTDAEASGVPFVEGADLHREITELADAYRAERFDAVVGSAGRLGGAVDAAESTLDKRIEELIERRAMLASIVAALPELGFEVDDASVEETADGAIGLRAYRSTGEGFSVLLRPGTDSPTEALYVTDGAREEARESEAGAECLDLVDVIEVLRQQAQNDGFESGAIRWEDDSYRRPPVARRHLPTDGGLAYGSGA